MCGIYARTSILQGDIRPWRSILKGNAGLIRIEIEPVWRFRREEDGRTIW